MLRCDEGNKGNAACAALLGWNRSRIATDVVGVIDLSMLRRPQLDYSQHKRRPIVTIGRSGYNDRPAGID